jgi:hypothetical protein
MQPERTDQRGSVRISLKADGRLSEPYAGQHDVELLDISESGARIATYRRFQVGQAIYLTFGKLRAVKCEVRWAKPGEIGVQFEQKLHVAILEHIAATNRP